MHKTFTNSIFLFILIFRFLSGLYPPLPDIDEIDFSLLREKVKQFNHTEKTCIKI